VKLPVSCLTFLFVVAPFSLWAQSNPALVNPSLADSSSSANAAGAAIIPSQPITPAPSLRPYARIAVGGGFSALGVNLQAAINANRYMNIRGGGNFFNYSVNNINVSGFNVDGKLNLGTAGAAVDFYPFPNHGFRVSPGLLFHNGNALSAAITASGGTSFTLNDTTYYSSASSPVTGAGSLILHAQRPAFTITTGWGNMISRRGGHWSFPFEIGAAMVGAPSVNLALTSGQVCSAPQGGYCQNVVSDSSLESNLQAQVAKYQKDVKPLSIYPILSSGVAYSFNIRRHGAGQIAHANSPEQP
jgi:hypothetical protein